MVHLSMNDGCHPRPVGRKKVSMVNKREVEELCSILEMHYDSGPRRDYSSSRDQKNMNVMPSN